MLDNTEDKAVKKKLEKVYDVISISPVKTHPNILQLESQILIKINALQEACAAKDGEAVSAQTTSLLLMINERNRQLKLLN